MPTSPPVFTHRRKMMNRHDHNKRSSWRTTKTYGMTTTQRGYGAQWRKIRNAVMTRDNYLCQVCKSRGYLTPANEVDHVVPKAEGGGDDIGNLQAICRKCHSEKTACESRRGAER